MNTNTTFEEGRIFLKSPINTPADIIKSQEDSNIKAPPIQKPYPNDAMVIELLSSEDITIGEVPFIEVVKKRRSRRKYSDRKLTSEEISFLLWSVQGIQRIGTKKPVTYRTVPASGGIHPFETYMVIQKVESIKVGLYRYLPIEHGLLYLKTIDPDLLENLIFACRGQEFVRKAGVVFIWTAIPSRTEWRYANEAHKAIAQASGHVCQNLYLASETIGAGTCAISAYAQKAMDELLGVDGEQEFTIYLASVGKVR